VLYFYNLVIKKNYFLCLFYRDNPKKRPWKVALTWGIADRFIEYCPDRDLRWNVWQAYEKAGSPADEKRELNNGLEVEEIRKLR